MTKREINIKIAEIKERKKKALSSPRAAKEFLASTGVYTENGNLRKPYK